MLRCTLLGLSSIKVAVGGLKKIIRAQQVFMSALRLASSTHPARFLPHTPSALRFLPFSPQGMAKGFIFGALIYPMCI